MPPVPEDAFIAAVDALVDADRDWVPDRRRTRRSTSGRTMMASRAVPRRPARPTSTCSCVIASPAGAYFPRGVQPVSVYLSEDYIRAAPGGDGCREVRRQLRGLSLAAQAQALAEKGCDQVVWLDAVELAPLEEMGGMNLFFVFGSGPTAPRW